MSQPPDPGPRRLATARLLDVLGQLGLPIGIGVVVGFWAADRGIRWLPDMLEALILLGAVCLLLMLAAMRLRRGHVHATPQGQRLRRRVAVIFGLLLLASIGWLIAHLAEQPSLLTLVPRESLGEAFDLDSAAFREHTSGLETLLDRLEQQPFLAADGHEPGVLGADEEALLLDAWTTTLDYTTVLEGTRQFWEDWYRFDPSRAERRWLLRAFLLSFATEAALVENAGRMGRILRRNPNALRFLDTPHPELGLEAGTFSRYSQSFEGSDDLAYVLAGAQYMRWMEDVMRWRADAWSEGLGWLWTDAEDRVDRMAALGVLDRAAMTVAGDGQPLRRMFRRAWLPAQQRVAERIGDTRLRRIGWYLITQEQQEQLDAQLVPGDVIVARKNWYLSNVGLPGWWPHGILYVGAPDKLVAWADDPDVRALVEELAGEPMAFDAYLARRFPHSFGRYKLGDGEHPFRLIESIKPGVVLSTLPHSAGDSLAALRPRLDKRAKAQAIIEAFSHLGKPYDFDFDFATDHALVCTELIWRAYRPAEGKAGLVLPVIQVAGRQTLPANEIVRMFARARGTASQQLDFVAFLDADEERQLTLLSDEAAFLTTPDRGKWSSLE
jgi:hypothetical protein